MPHKAPWEPKPDWVIELQRLRETAGRPAYHAIAKKAGLSVGYVHEIIRGSQPNPSYDAFQRILFALTADDELRTKVDDIFRLSLGAPNLERDPEAWRQAVTPDMRMLCETLLKAAHILAGRTE